MSTRVIPDYSAARDNEAIRAVYIVSTSNRARDTGDFYRIRYGVASENGTDWLGEYDQSKHALTANKRFDMTTDEDLNWGLQDGDETVIEITKTGSPSSLDGVKVEMKGHRVGELGSTEAPRADETTLPGSRPLIQKLFTGEASTPEVERLAAVLNDSGVVEFGSVTALSDGAALGTSSGIVTDTDTDTFSGLTSGTLATQGTVVIEGLDSSVVYIIVVHATGFVESSSGASHFQFRIQEDGGAVTGLTHDVHSSGTGVHAVMACNLVEEVGGETSRTYDFDMNRSGGSGSGSGSIEWNVVAYPKSPLVSVS